MRKIDPSLLAVRPFHLLDQEWGLVVAGAERPNLMTVSWGSLGTAWSRPVVTLFVRPTRHTFALLEAHPEFTLNILSHDQRGALEECAAWSGRDGDKWRATGLTPEPSEQIAVPRVAGADLSLECRTLADVDLDPARFRGQELATNYGERDYHRVYFGEVVAAFGNRRFLAP